MLRARDGVKLRTIVTRPRAASGRLPAILFVQWLSCDTIELPANAHDGWSEMIRGVVRRSSALVWRTEKRGVGDSEGDCETMDYETELADHRQALVELRKRPDVDPRRIVIFGGSIGTTYAPLLAADQELAGVMIWGGGATTWFERMMRFERNALELRGDDPQKWLDEMNARARFFERYLLRGELPSAIIASDPELGKVWSRIVGTKGDSHYGRPAAFHQQAARQNWAGAWARVRAPVLVLGGQYDWFESHAASALVAEVVNRQHPGRAEFHEYPGLNHHLSKFPSAEAAFKESGGTVSAEPVVATILSWLAKVGVTQ
jgi:pimeloyl-ACP methyl ester carboxylesterase